MNKKIVNFKIKKNDKPKIITTRELGKYILETGCVPTPIYTKNSEKIKKIKF